MYGVEKKNIFNQYKKIIVLIFICMISFCNTVFANYDINAVFNKEYTITYNDEEKRFFNGNGSRVYPIFYEGTNYLPIRAVSSLFDIKIKWDAETNTIYLGEGEVDSKASKNYISLKEEVNENIIATVNEKIKVMYNGKMQEFIKLL